MNIRRFGLALAFAGSVTTGVLAGETSRTIHIVSQESGNILAGEEMVRIPASCPFNEKMIDKESLSERFIQIFGQMEEIKEKEGQDALIIEISGSIGQDVEDDNNCTISNQEIVLSVVSQEYSFMFSYSEPEQVGILTHQDKDNIFNAEESLTFLKNMKSKDIQGIQDFLNNM